MTDRLDELDQLLQGGSSDERPATASLLRRAATLPEAMPAPDLLAAMAHEARSAVDPSPHRSPIQPRRRSMFATKIAVAAAAITLTAAGAAAAGGSLPDAAQDGLAEAGSHIGLDLPDAASDDARDATTSEAEAEAEAETNVDAESNTETGSTEDERGNLTNPTDADEHGETVSSIANDDSLSGREKGAAVSAAASGRVEGDGTAQGEASAEDEGEGERPEDITAPVEIPNEGDAAPVQTPNGGEASADARAEAEVRFGS